VGLDEVVPVKDVIRMDLTPNFSLINAINHYAQLFINGNFLKGVSKNTGNSFIEMKECVA